MFTQTDPKEPSKTQWRRHLILLTAAVLVSWPGLIYGIVMSHDIINHVVWHTNFSQQFWQGDLYPRWLSEVYAGLGAPVFFFYGPVPFFFGTVIHLIFNAVLAPVQQVGLSATITLFLSAVGAYYWFSGRFEKDVALVGALIYLLVPYHLYVDYYVRFAYGELWAMTFQPYLLLFADRIVHRRSFGMAGLICAYGLLVMTHMPTTLIFSPLLLVYPLMAAEPARRRSAMTRVVIAMVLGVCLTAVYFIPAMTLQDTVHLNILQRGNMNYAGNFLFDFNDNRSANLSHLILMAAITGLTLLLWLTAVLLSFFRHQGRSRQWVVFWLTVALIALFMMLPWSKPVWMAVPAIQKVSFPWRYHTVFSFATAALMVYGIAAMQQGRRRLIGALFILMLLPMGLHGLFFPEYPLVATKGFGKKASLYVNNNVCALEYIPSSASRRTLNKSTPQMRRLEFTKGQGVATIQSWQARRIDLDVTAETDVQLRLKQFYYPGWRAQSKGKEGTTTLSAYPTPEQGLLGVAVPRGHHTVTIRLTRNRAELAGWAVSGITLLGLFGYWGYRRIRF